MKVLLLGDFSGVHFNLKKGLVELGAQVTLMAKGDGFKNIPADIRLYTRKNEPAYLGAYREMADQLKKLRLLKGHDVVQLASHRFFHNRINSRLIPYVIKHNKHSVLLHTACSFPYHDFVQTLKYSPCAECKLHDIRTDTCIHASTKERALENKIYSLSEQIISTHYEYHQAMQKTNYRSKSAFVLLPVDLSEHPFSGLKHRQKINIYYGEIRKGFKGGSFIEKALEKLKTSSLAEKVNIITTSKLPYHDYVKILEDADIVIDQSQSYTYGMNALFALSRGKIVLSGAEPVALEAQGIPVEECPIINIEPDEEKIFLQLTELINRFDHYRPLAEKGRVFMEKYHDHLKVAQQFMNCYQNLSEKK